MFAIIGQATSAKDNESYPEGEIHSTMLFISSDSRENAIKIAVSELEEGGWVDVRLRKIGTIDSESFNSPDPVIQESFESAVADGASIITYQGVDEEYTT